MTEYTTFNSNYNTIIDYINNQIIVSDCIITDNQFENFTNFIDKKCTSQIKNLVLKIYQEFLVSRSPISWSNFIVKLHKEFLDMEKIEFDELKTVINKCEQHLTNINSMKCNDDISRWFKELCAFINVLFKILLKRINVATTDNIKNYLILYAVQITTCTTLILKLFSEEISTKLLITESRRFLEKRYIYIFDGIRKILNENKCIEQDPGFLQWVDNSLDLLKDLYPNNTNLDYLNKVETSTKQVLCLAMSIAKISSKDDTKKVTAGVQAVLRELEQLKLEFSGNLNPSFINLYVDLISDKLCILENKINTAVLNMFLNIFSDPLMSLKTLQNTCKSSDKKYSDRSESDLDDYVTNLDNSVDCMIQIGLFAIACSTNNNIIAYIRNCLASLEYLECELVPTIVSSYLEENYITYLHSKLFSGHWETEVLKLQQNICFIIDPLAFGQVVFDDLKTNIEYIQLKKEYLTQNTVTLISNKVKLLLSVIDASVPDMNISKESVIHNHIENLKKVNSEVCAASKLLTNNYTLITDKVIKRILILSTMVQRVNSEFSKINNTTIDTKNETIDDTQNVNISIESLEKHGTQILKNRSVLYKTPKNKTQFTEFATPMTTKKFQSRKLGITSARKCVFKQIEDSGDTLDLTKILDDLTNTWNSKRSLSMFLP